MDDKIIVSNRAALTAKYGGVGKRVKCDGFVVGYSLLAERIETLR